MDQYGGDMDAFLADLGDATKVTAVISENFNSVELLGLRELMVERDIRKINEYEREWLASHAGPQIPKFSAAGWRQRLEDLTAGKRDRFYDKPTY
jgi:hypothetical protein